MKVYKRTSEGQWAAYDEHSPLPRKLKILLKAINGKVPEDVYVNNLGSFGDVRALLLSLEQAGLIAHKAHRTDTPAALAALGAQPPGSEPTARAQQAMDQTVVIPQLEGLRRPSAVQWQALPELTELSMPAALAAPKAAAAHAATPAPALIQMRAESPRAPPVLTQVVAGPDAKRLDEMDALAALADLAELAGQSAPAAHATQASNILAHNALLAANDGPIEDANSQRSAVRHAVALMSKFVLEHLPRSASQVLPEIESLHSVDQWAELIDGYAVFITPTGELGRAHLQHIRGLLDQAVGTAGLDSKGWYA